MDYTGLSRLSVSHVSNYCTQCIGCRQLQQLEEQKQQLEHFNATIQEEKDSLLQQNTVLTERLEAVVNEKLPHHQFDGQTPIDKTLDLLQNLIMVWPTHTFCCVL